MKKLKEVLDIVRDLDIPQDAHDQLVRNLTYLIQKEFERAQKIAKVHEAMAELRLNVKYLMFDLEATKRERDELKP